MLAYTAAVFKNCGNYRHNHQGVKYKFIPEFGVDKFKLIIKSSPNYQEHKKFIDRILDKIALELYNDDPFITITRDDTIQEFYSPTIAPKEMTFLNAWLK